MEEEVKFTEGYWKATFDSPEDLPWPEPCTDAIWPLLKDSFLQRLASLELRCSDKVVQYKGMSICRLCQECNGSKESRYEGWRWPEGYMHYLEVHNVAPSFEFWQMVVLATPLIAITKFEAIAKKKKV